MSYPASKINYFFLLFWALCVKISKRVKIKAIFFKTSYDKLTDMEIYYIM
jgi:hypothetical protein